MTKTCTGQFPSGDKSSSKAQGYMDKMISELWTIGGKVREAQVIHVDEEKKWAQDRALAWGTPEKTGTGCEVTPWTATKCERSDRYDLNRRMQGTR